MVSAAGFHRIVMSHMVLVCCCCCRSTLLARRRAPTCQACNIGACFKLYSGALLLLLQVNIVGKAQSSYLPGVLVPEINAGGVAERAGFMPGDVILRVGDFIVPANPSQVSNEAAVILGQCTAPGPCPWLVTLYFLGIIRCLTKCPPPRPRLLDVVLTPLDGHLAPC